MNSDTTTAGMSFVVDEDNMSSNSATKVPTQQSVKAYVDAQLTAQDLDFQADSGGALAIDLDSEEEDVQNDAAKKRRIDICKGLAAICRRPKKSQKNPQKYPKN